MNKRLERMPPDEVSRLRVCVVRHGPFYSDPRVVKETISLLDGASAQVTVLFRGERAQPWFSRDGLTVRSYGNPPSENPALLALQAMVFGLWVVARIWNLRPQTAIIHSIPSWLLLILVPLRRLGRVGALLLDHHEPEAEMLVEAGVPASIAELYRRVEARSLRISDGVIDVSDVMARRSSELGASRQLVIDNCPQRFLNASRRAEPHWELAVFGSLIKRYDLPVLEAALGLLDRPISVVQIGQGPCRLTGNPSAGEFADLGYLNPPELQATLLDSTFGFVGLAPSRFTPYISPNRLWELVALGIPAIVARTPLIEELLQDGAVYYEGGCPASLAAAILESISLDQQQRDQVAAKASSRLSSRAWGRQSSAFVQFVSRTIDQAVGN
jgi:glycosyltransferase involved in cell wall biosynthesis